MWPTNVKGNRQTLKCWVGGDLLGTRQDYEDKFLYCLDCNWTYHWKPLIDKPIPAWKGREDSSKCGCNGCG